jgi:uncharacterized protein YjeT (DUF2065 family)
VPVLVPTVPLLVRGSFPLALSLTIVVEGLIVLAYAAARGLRIRHWLAYAVLINTVTQPALWYLMGLLPVDIAYFPALTAAESLVWVVEAGLLHLLARGRLGVGHALMLSLVLNVASCGAGLLLPV